MQCLSRQRTDQSKGPNADLESRTRQILYPMMGLITWDAISSANIVSISAGSDFGSKAGPFDTATLKALNKWENYGEYVYTEEAS